MGYADCQKSIVYRKKRMETIEKMNEIVSSMESFLTDEKESILIKYRKSGNQEERFDEEWYLENWLLPEKKTAVSVILPSVRIGMT